MFFSTQKPNKYIISFSGYHPRIIGGHDATPGWAFE